MALDELLYLRQFIKNQFSLLDDLADQYETTLKQKLSNGSETEFALKLFQKIRKAIVNTKNEAENFSRNYFSVVPSEIFSVIISNLSFQELGRMASVSKNFYVIITAEERWK